MTGQTVRSTDLQDQAVRRDVVLGGRVLDAAGLSDLVWGHVSHRDPAGRGVWMKASGLGFDEVSENSVLLIDPSGTVLGGDGPAHKEYPIHTELLKARDDLHSVVHVHPPHAIALAASDTELQAFSHVGGIFSRGVPRYHDAVGLIDTPEAGAALAAALGDSRAIMLVGHGIVTVGPSLPIAVITAVMLERACRQQLLAEQFGGATARPVGDVAERGYAHTLTDEHILGAWRYLARKASRPDEIQTAD